MCRHSTLTRITKMRPVVPFKQSKLRWLIKYPHPCTRDEVTCPTTHGHCRAPQYCYWSFRFPTGSSLRSPTFPSETADHRPRYVRYIIALCHPGQCVKMGLAPKACKPGTSFTHGSRTLTAAWAALGCQCLDLDLKVSDILLLAKASCAGHELRHPRCTAIPRFKEM